MGGWLCGQSDVIGVISEVVVGVVNEVVVGVVSEVVAGEFSGYLWSLWLVV